VSVKETQALARHATPELTMNVYGRVREERLSAAVEKVERALLPDEERVICVHRKAVGADENAATPPNNKQLRHFQMGGGGERTPPPPIHYRWVPAAAGQAMSATLVKKRMVVEILPP
jgi:hypothetical protein